LLGWRLKFEDRDEPTVCTVRGGNLLAVDESGNYIYPIAPARNVTVILSQSTAASLIAEWSQTDINYVKDVLAKIESALRPKATFRL
jgi:hypothetical protein